MRLARWRLGPMHVTMRVTTEPWVGVRKTVTRPRCDGYAPFDEGTEGDPTSTTDAWGERLARMALCGGCRELASEELERAKASA